MPGPVIAVHGGAGSRQRADAGDAWDAAIRAGLRASLEAGHRVLAAGGSALDAVEQAVRVLEDDEHFNAGRGSVLDANGDVTMDASIMSGRHRRAGAVAGVSGVVHPISAARLVMERTSHVLLVGAEASSWCAEHGLEIATPDHFVTERRRRQLKRSRNEGESVGLDNLATVGAVALDAEGNLAAATSTGGITSKLPGRVGDSAIIGAGTWADNKSCAVSATGIGEAIMRAAFAHDVHASMRFRRVSLEEACLRAMDGVVAIRGAIGCVAVDSRGRTAMPFSTPAMPRGVMRAPDDVEVAIGRKPTSSP